MRARRRWCRGAEELAAIRALGLPPITGEIVNLDTGLVRRVGGPPSIVFGVDVFRRTTMQFLPLLSGPVPPDYKVGPGDNLVLILAGDLERAYSLQLTRSSVCIGVAGRDVGRGWIEGGGRRRRGRGGRRPWRPRRCTNPCSDNRLTDRDLTGKFSVL